MRREPSLLVAVCSATQCKLMLPLNQPKGRSQKSFIHTKGALKVAHRAKAETSLSGLLLLHLWVDLFDCYHRQEQPLLGFRERNEPEILIELVGLLIFSIDYDRRGCDLSTHCERSFQGIDQEQLSNTLPLVGEITCKPSKE